MTITLSVYDASVMNYSLTNILYSIPEDNQEIYLSNAATGKYVDIAERSIQNNAVIEQQNYSSINSQQWRVCHDNNSIGYFRLMSVHSNKYLAIDQTNQSIVEQTDDSQSNYSLWKLDWTLTGNMILLCKATENNNMVLSLPVNNQGIGANLTMLTYTQDGNYNDEWYIIKNVISYVNYYDSTFSGEDSMIESISNANAFAHLVFARYYHVGFYMDGAAGQYATIADDCPTGVNTECSLDICGAVCYRNHHKYVQDISTQIYNSPREDNHIYVLWTNRADGTYCGNTIYQEHVTFEGTLAVVHSKRPVIHFLTIFDDPLEIDAYMSIVLAHETSHTLKMDDVYVVDGHDIDFDTKCIMERYDINTAYDFYLDVIVGNEKPFCNYCDQLMKNHTDNIVINGNVEED